MVIKKLGSADIDDFLSLIHIYKIVFENTSAVLGRDHIQKLLNNPDFIVFVVKLDKEVIGGLTFHVLHSYFSAPQAYIYDVGIKPDFQNKGYGKALMAEVCNYCERNGFAEAYVEAESDDIGAVEFYRRTNYTSEMKAIHFTYKLGYGSKK